MDGNPFGDPPSTHLSQNENNNPKTNILCTYKPADVGSYLVILESDPNIDKNVGKISYLKLAREILT